MLSMLLAKIQAGCGGVSLRSWEPEDAITELIASQTVQKSQWSVASWDAHKGLRTRRQTFGEPRQLMDPVEALDHALAMQRQHSATSEQAKSNRTVFFLANAQRFFQSAKFVQALYNHAVSGAEAGMTVVLVVPPGTSLPSEIEKVYSNVDQELPDVELLTTVVKDITEAADFVDATLEQTVDALRGLTREEAREAVATSLVLHRKVDLATLWQSKRQSLEKAMLELSTSKVRFADIGGYAHLKQYCLKMLRAGKNTMRADDILLLGVPGAGKTTFAEALGNEIGWPTVLFSLGRLKDKHVGSSEAHMIRALKTIDSIAPCVVVLDEIEKMMAGAGNERGGGGNDSGVSQALLQEFLTWTASRTSQSLLIATANNVEALPDALVRNGRLGDTFFCDLPTPEEANEIWNLYCKQYNVIASPELRARSRDWSGVDIKTACKKAAILGEKDVSAVADLILPIMETRPESVAWLRDYVDGKVLSASTPGRYSKAKREESALTNGRIRPKRAVARG